MTIPVRKSWTQEEFLAWAAAQGGRYEFDGFKPVAMTGGTAGHDDITFNLRHALDHRLRGSSCRPLGPTVGIETVNQAIRYPDAFVTCSKLKGTDRIIPGAVVVFEVVGPDSDQIDHYVKFREYTAVPSIRRYVMVESLFVGLTVLQRQTAAEAWRLMTLMENGILQMPEIGIEIPVDDIYKGIDFDDEIGFGT